MCSLLFGVDDGHDNLAEESQGDEPLLGIGEPVILVRVGHTLEHLLSVNEIESVLLEVPPSLRLIPRDHPWSVYTKCIRVKRWRPEGRTFASGAAGRCHRRRWRWPRGARRDTHSYHGGERPMRITYDCSAASGRTALTTTPV